MAFVFSMRQIVRAGKDVELSQMLDIEQLRLESTVEAKIAMVVKMANSPVIMRHFANPEDPELKEIALEEINSFRGFFHEGYEISWVNDIDRMVYSTVYDEPYWLDADNPAHYWYYATLEADGYNFNVNYNPNTKAFKMWVNAPVLHNDGKPAGMVAVALELTTFINRFYQDIEDNIEIYLFNSAGEITGAKDVGLVISNANITDELSQFGIDVAAMAKTLNPGETQSFAVSQGALAIGTVPSLGWYTAAFKPDSINDYYTPMTTLFLVVLAAISLIFVIFNIFIARFLRYLHSTMGSLIKAQSEAQSQKQIADDTRVEIEAAQTATELQLAKLNLIIETAEIGMVNMELEPGNPLSPNNHVEYSDGYKKLLGYTDDEKTPGSLGESRLGLVHPDDMESSFRAFSEHLLDKTGSIPFDIEQRLKKKNGEYAWFRTVGRAIRDKDGNPVRFVNAAFDLTETKRALINNELQLARMALINKAAGIGLWDMEIIRDDPMNIKNLITYSNEFRAILGYTDENDFPDVIGSFNDCLHPDDFQMVTNALTAHIADTTGKTPFNPEYQAKKKNGEYTYIRATGESIRDEDGNAIRAVGTIMDVSKEKNMIKAIEQQRDESEFRTQEFISKFSVPFTQPYDFDELINNALFELRDFTKTDRAIVLEFQSSDLLRCTYESVINQNTSSVLNTLILYEDNKLIFDKADKTGCFYKKEAERYLEETNNKGFGEKSFCCIPLTIGGNRAGYLVFFTMFEQANWAENEFHLVTMAGSIIAGAYSRKFNEDIITISREEEIRTQEFISKFSAPFTQPYNFDELINNALFELRDFTKTDRASILEFQADGSLLCTHESVINEQTPGIFGRSLLYKDAGAVFAEAERTGCFYEKKAEQYYLNNNLTGLDGKSFCCIPLMAEGERAGYLVLFTMFEQANWAEDEFRLVTMTGSIIAGAYAIRKNDELKEAAIKAQQENQAKSNFLSVMSHEIRTPMNSILGITEILLRDEAASENIIDGLHRIFYSGDLLLKIINDILDLSKIEAGMLELNPYKYETASLINDIAVLNIMRIGSKPVEFELSVDENLPTYMTGDELRIKQILENLLSNAFKYTDEGKITLAFSIEKGSEETDLKLVVVVSDTGQGMTEEQVNNIFNEYTRFNFEANRTTQGTGLGMSIVQNLVRMMKGDIDVKSKINEGTTITVRLSQEYFTSEILSRELAENLQNYRHSGMRQMKKAQMLYEPMPYGSVLIVDDVESNLFVAKGLMSPYKLNFDTATNGFDALKKVENGNVYDIIFMDHMMPKMDGIETTKLIREHGYEHPIIALTANAVSGRRGMFLSNGFDDFISKPIDIRQLNDILKKFIRDKQSPEILEAIRRKTQLNEPVAAFGSMQKVLSNENLIKVAVKDIETSLSALRSVVPSINNDGSGDLSLYTTTVHGMKSALANIGETELSQAASKLEEAGNQKAINVVLTETAAFMDSLQSLIDKLKPPKVHSTEDIQDDIPLLHEKMKEIAEACSSFNIKAARKAIDELKQKKWSEKTTDILDEISMDLLRGDFDKILITAENELKGN
jgi:PAS domain S-box-containing protein